MTEIPKPAYIQAEEFCIAHNLPFSLITTYANGSVMISFTKRF